MSYCLKPTCEHPQNPEDASYCLSCGSHLLLQERYRAIAAIAQGGFGRTFLAVDESQPSQPRCAIKQFFPQVQDRNNKQQATELFRQEALKLAVLGKHPQLPELLAHCEQDGQQYLVQEFIDGQNLAQELAEDGAFNETQIRQLLKNLLPVLQFIHDHQIIHRDIKPANIIRRSCDSQLVLVDFGAAKYATGKALAQTATVIGSAEYAAPEQAKGKAVFTSDLYSLGVTCIYLLSQVSPFDLFDSSEDTWVWRDYLSHPVSESLSGVLDKLLQRATKRRYQSAQDVLNDLNAKPIQVVSHRILDFGFPILDWGSLTAGSFQDLTCDSNKTQWDHSLSTSEAPAKILAQDNPKSADRSRSVKPMLSATVFDPQTKSWNFIPNLAEHSASVQLVAPFLRSRPATSSNILLQELMPQATTLLRVSKKTTRVWWLLSVLGAVVALAVAAVSSQPPSPSLGMKHFSRFSLQTHSAENS